MSKLRHLAGRGVSRKIFILGSGRSGTHWIGYTLQAHDGVRATVEAEPAFGWATQMALDPGRRAELYPRLVRYYRKQHLRSVPRHYLDKTHPNIWLAEPLAGSFPDAVFIGIIRNPYATVASMLRHRGVLQWHERWREFPVPNDFLGITGEGADAYEELPLAAKCALRWRAHRDQMGRLKTRLGDRILVVEYESLFHDTAAVLRDVEHLVGLTSPIPIPEVRTTSLDKWREQLTEAEVQQIQDVVGFSPGDVPPSYGI